MSRTVELVAPWAGPDFESRGVVEFVVSDGASVYPGQKIASFLYDVDGVALIEFDVVTEHSGVLRHHCNEGFKAHSLQMIASVEVQQSSMDVDFSEDLFNSYAKFSKQTASKFETCNFYPIVELPFDKQKLLGTLGGAHRHFLAINRNYDQSVIGKAIDTVLRHTPVLTEPFFSRFDFAVKFPLMTLPKDFPFYVERRLNQLHEKELLHFCDRFDFDFSQIPFINLGSGSTVSGS